MPVEMYDAALDLVGGPSQSRLFDFVKPDGVLVSSVSLPDNTLSGTRGVRTDFLIVDVDTHGLEVLTDLFRTGIVQRSVGEVLPLSEARQAHELMTRASHLPGKIVLRVAGGQ